MDTPASLNESFMKQVETRLKNEVLQDQTHAYNNEDKKRIAYIGIIGITILIIEFLLFIPLTH